ncbi:hypothetical protein TBLA_0I00690 [Henningerozyma blattae CBS 6284]|uniref:Dihydrofolate synthetase n=1 Tax=Henningerozyma blattae (strain ATCC 34711 / CBS 6284 / DSM 70876 / NBRC 10599 / NRRL Y-10934 / UCD 77-7) TaxID=1071380 RepID=I2H8M5_HENB6|nr:hypothetical protein TBLA_0I00690 [Tetrapisispora blattae CBS 6284]CCH62727.1 hypothetical protein TBLA_0I00690 [Tetrapisispora blattae CBS 6284]
MSIILGLTRVTKLLSFIGNPETHLQVIHIAGTNGKGSVCSYISSVLQQIPNAKIGKFTTPHLIHVTDSISVNEIPISDGTYRRLRKEVENINKLNSLECTEFEIMTCTALKYFHNIKCKWCVIEVGLGGRLDATNVIPGVNKKACGITKIGLDHESFLGNTLQQIASEKAGIITKGVKFVAIDGTNAKEVLKVVEDRCKEIKDCVLQITEANGSNWIAETQSWGTVNLSHLPLNGQYQIFNSRVAVSILDNLQQRSLLKISIDQLLSGFSKVEWPGRLQEFIYKHDLEEDSVSFLMDGAHNGSAAIELSNFLKTKYGPSQPLTFVLAVTNGKTLQPLLDPLLSAKDNVVVTEFESVDGMPWIKAMDSTELKSKIQEYTSSIYIDVSVPEALKHASEISKLKNTPIVVCGSLYLCGQILRLQNNQTAKSNF